LFSLRVILISFEYSKEVVKIALLSKNFYRTVDSDVPKLDHRQS
jgi:hypothetical protein